MYFKMIAFNPVVGSCLSILLLQWGTSGGPEGESGETSEPIPINGGEVRIKQLGSRREKTCLRKVANNKCADQPAHPRSLISAFVIRLLESIISRLATSKISIF